MKAKSTFGQKMKELKEKRKANLDSPDLKQEKLNQVVEQVRQKANG